MCVCVFVGVSLMHMLMIVYLGLALCTWRNLVYCVYPVVARKIAQFYFPTRYSLPNTGYLLAQYSLHYTLRISFLKQTFKCWQSTPNSLSLSRSFANPTGYLCICICAWASPFVGPQFRVLPFVCFTCSGSLFLFHFPAN